MEWTQERLDACIKEWQTLLNLSSFSVWSRLMSSEEMFDYHKREAAGFCTQDFVRKTARIDFADPNDKSPYRLDGAPEDDPEETIVHEVMHIWSQQIIRHLETVAKYAPEPVMEVVRENMSEAEEQMNDAIAAALVSLKRRAKDDLQ